MGRMLRARGRLRRGELALYAGLLQVSPRTLRKWRDQATDPPVMGRPRLAAETWRAAVVPVARAWRCQGRSAGLPRVRKLLKEQGLAISTTVARELLRRLKARWTAVEARKRADRRRSVVVHGRDVMWSQDATHLGRDEHGKVELLAVKDVATTTAIEHSIGGAATAEDVLGLLVRAKLVRGALPLVLAMDNGPANRNALVCSYLRAEREAILCTLEELGLVTRTRGTRPATCSKAARLS